jgi:hypothetical protein
MNILRQPPFPLSVLYDGLDPETDYILEIYDNHAFLILSEVISSDSSGAALYELPSNFEKYDETYSLYIYTMDLNDDPDQTVVIDNLYIYRPYINPLSLADLDCDDQEYIDLERTARQIIDTIVGGFYYTSGELETVGLGADYLPLPKRSNRINQVYENNVKVYDRLDPIEGQHTYILSPDKTAMTIQVDGTQSYNRFQSKQVHLPIAASDSFMFYGDDYDAVAQLTEIKGSSFFPKDWDYTVYGEWGWPVVPQDIRDATRMLINDLKCGKLSYIQKYVTEYQTDQFKVKYSDLSLRGTGNLLVDKILENYSLPIYKLGVL